MTTNRARAYGRVLTLISDLGPAKLHPSEQQAVRDAADALLFSVDVASDADAREALGALVEVVDNLVDSERLLRETGEDLLDAVEACGPQTEPMALPAAA
jgi:hypothetical protein